MESTDIELGDLTGTAKTRADTTPANGSGNAVADCYRNGNQDTSRTDEPCHSDDPHQHSPSRESTVVDDGYDKAKPLERALSQRYAEAHMRVLTMQTSSTKLPRLSVTESDLDSMPPARSLVMERESSIALSSVIEPLTSTAHADLLPAVPEEAVPPPCPPRQRRLSVMSQLQLDDADTLKLRASVQRTVDFLRAAPRLTFVILFFLALVLFGCWGAWTYARPDAVGVPLPSPVNVALPFAKACGRMVTLIVCLLAITALRTFSRVLMTIPIVRLAIPVSEFMPRFHKYLAWMGFVFALGHVIGHSIDIAMYGGDTPYYVNGKVVYLFPWVTGYCWTFKDNERPLVCLVTTGSILIFVYAVIVTLSTIYIFCRRAPSNAGAAKREEGARVPLSERVHAALTPSFEFRDKVYKRLLGGPSGRYKAFLWLSHWICAPIFAILLCIHAQSKMTSYVAIPIVFLTCAVAVDMMFRYGTYPVRVIVEECEVVMAAPGRAPPSGPPPPPQPRLSKLVITRPLGFTFVPGQAALVRSRGRSRLEFHPFSIASPPTDDRLIFFIGASGDWTRQLALDLAAAGARICTCDAVGNEAFEGAEEFRKRASAGFVRLDIDVSGPHGAPAQIHDGFDDLVLVGAGAGVTPMTSIFREICHLRATEIDALLGDAGVGAKPADTEKKGADSLPAPLRRASTVLSIGSLREGAKEEETHVSDVWPGATAHLFRTTRHLRFLTGPYAVALTFVFALLTALLSGAYTIIDAFQSLEYDKAVFTVFLVLSSLTVALSLARLAALSYRIHLLWHSRHTRARVRHAATEMVVEAVFLLLAAAGLGLAAWGWDHAAEEEDDSSPEFLAVFYGLLAQSLLLAVFSYVRTVYFLHRFAPHTGRRFAQIGTPFTLMLVAIMSTIEYTKVTYDVIADGTNGLSERTAGANDVNKDYNACFLNREFKTGAAIRAKLAPRDTHTSFEVPADGKYVGAADFKALVKRRLELICRDSARDESAARVLGVFYCGRDDLGKLLRKAVVDVQTEHLVGGKCHRGDCYISFHKEEF